MDFTASKLASIYMRTIRIYKRLQKGLTGTKMQCHKKYLLLFTVGSSSSNDQLVEKGMSQKLQQGLLPQQANQVTNYKCHS